jgi:hypothetical protein
VLTEVKGMPSRWYARLSRWVGISWFGWLPTAALLVIPASQTHATLPSGTAAFSEDFDYPAGTDLPDTVLWDGTATDEIETDSAGPWVKFSGGVESANAYHTMSYSANVIFVHVLVKPGPGTGTMWGLWYDDPAGNNLARWYGGPTSCRGRIGGTSVVTNGPVALIPDVWNDLDARINTVANTSEFYLNGAYMGTLDHTSTPSNTLGIVRFERVGNSEAVGSLIYFDQLRVGQDPGSPAAPPAAPTVGLPASGAVLQTLTASVAWTGDFHDMYEIHVNTSNNSADADGWDSGQVAASPGPHTTGALRNGARYYVFVRLRNAIGWGPWSTVGCHFDVSIPPLIIPQPQEITWYPGTGFQVNAQTQIVMPVSPDAKDNVTANQLQRKVWDMTGFLPPIVQGTPGAPAANVIAIGESARNSAAAAILAGWPGAAGKTPKSEGYLLGVSNSAVVIGGFDQRGTFYGCQTLIQLLEQFGSGAIIGCFSYDYPDRPWRGMMISVRYKFDMDFAKEIMSELFARFKLNIVHLDISFGTIWESHPELYLPPNPPKEPSHMDEAQEVGDFAKQYFLDVMPAGPSWTGSDAFITAGTLYPLLRENRGDPDNAVREELCPRNPQSQQIMHDLWTELINHFQPTRIETGWDELSTIGNSACPYCAGTAPTTLFNEFLWNDYNWLHARGITPVMWADMLTTEMNGNNWNLYQVAATMPKGTVLQDWEYLRTGMYPRLDTWWNANGLRSVGAPFGVYDPPGMANFWWWGQSVHQYNTLGIVAFNKYRLHDKSDLLVVPPGDNQMQNLACYPFAGEWSWKPDGRVCSPLPYDGKAVVRTAVSPDRVAGFTASPAGQDVNLSWTNPGDSTYQATWICCRADRTPTSPIDGTLVADVPGTPGGAGSFTHTAAPLCPALYYAAFAHDGVRHFSAPSTVSLTGASLPDTDNDGVADVCDQCPNTIPGMIGHVDDQGCPPLVPGDFDRDGDVDAADFGPFNACASGPGVPYSEGCGGKSLDGDGDVDQSDFGLFQRCLSGANAPADANCAN